MILVLLSLCAHAAAPVTYAVDPAQGLVYVEVRKDESTVLAGLSHDHVIRAGALTGVVTWSAEDPAACSIELALPVASLEVDPPWLRDRVGLTQRLKDGDRETIRRHMLDEGQLFAAAHPTITFTSTRCTGQGEAVVVEGALRIRGQAAPVRATMTVQADGQQLRARGAFDASHAAFGMRPFQAAMGALKNQEGLRFEVELVATVPAGAPAPADPHQ